MKKLAPALALIILALCIFGCTPQKDKDALPTPVQTDAEQTPPVSSMPEAVRPEKFIVLARCRGKRKH